MFSIFAPDTKELAEYELPAREFFKITGKNGLDYQCEIIRPNNFDPDQQYPVIVYTYGGPHGQVVRNSWGGKRYLWHALMAQRGYIIFSLDNRGSWGRGTAWEDPLYKKMGHVELEDPVQVVTPRSTHVLGESEDQVDAHVDQAHVPSSLHGARGTIRAVQPTHPAQGALVERLRPEAQSIHARLRPAPSEVR